MRRFLLPLLLLTCAAVGCERAVDIQIPTASPRLVVEARLERVLDAGAVAQTIRLSTTADYFSEALAPPASGAVVRVTDDLNRVTIFTETSVAGTYRAPTTFTVGRGRRYTLTIDFEGQSYTATDSTQQVPRVGSLYFAGPQAGRYSGTGGVRVAITFSDPPTVRNFYLWEQYVNGVRQLGPDSTVRMRVIGTDQIYDGRAVEGFQPFEGVHIPSGASVLVRQIALAEATYRYYFALNDQLSDGGSPFAVPPATARGNVENRTDTSRPALGYFYVSEVSERRGIYLAGGIREQAVPVTR